MLPDAAPRNESDEAICQRVIGLLAERVGMRPPSRDTDLTASGLLDSLALVDLLAGLEEEFAIVIDLGDVDLERFRSVDSTAEFVAERLAARRRAAPRRGSLVELAGSIDSRRRS